MPKNPKPSLGRNPDRGICIKIDSYKHVTAMCVKEATKYLDEYINVLSKDPKKLEQFLNHTAEILNYCDKDKLNYCDDLRAYLLKVTKRAEECAKARAEALLPKVDPPLNNKELETVTSILEEKVEPAKEEVKPVVEENPKPEVVAEVPKVEEKVETEEEEVQRPKPRPEIDPLDLKILAYSNDPNTRKMIARMREIYTRRCNARGCRGKKGNVPGGACWRYVKHGLMKGSYADEYMSKNDQSYPYTATASAKNAGKDFFNTKEVGFTNLLKTDKYSELTSADAPVGAVLVYSGGKHGHVEVKTGHGEYISDYRADKPTDQSSPYRAKTRKLVGIYVKID